MDINYQDNIWELYGLKNNPFSTSPILVNEGFLPLEAFVGRDEEIKRLNTILRMGDGTRTIVTGDTGVGKTTDKKILDNENVMGEKNYPYVTTQASNNGAREFYNTFTDEGNVLTIDSAVLGFCSYQPLNFTASDHVEKLVPKFDLNVYRALFLTTIINMEQYRYSYGRKFNQDRIRETTIKLPFRDGDVDWDWIENYIKGLSYSKHLSIKQ